MECGYKINVSYQTPCIIYIHLLSFVLSSITEHTSSPRSTSSRDSSSSSAQTGNPEQRTNQTARRPEDRNNGDHLDTSLEEIRKQQFDVFLSFAEEDERFAEEVRQRLVENTNAKVFVPSSGE